MVAWSNRRGSEDFFRSRPSMPLSRRAQSQKNPQDTPTLQGNLFRTHGQQIRPVLLCQLQEHFAWADDFRSVLKPLSA